MVFPRIVALASLFLLSGASAALAGQTIEPRAGVLLKGQIPFARPQAMSIRTDHRDGTRLTVVMGFDGRCSGGGLAEVWAGGVRAKPIVRTHASGRIDATLTGTVRRLGGVDGRVGSFKWRLSGRFSDDDVVVATITGTADVSLDGKRISRCRIAGAPSVRLRSS